MTNLRTVLASRWVRWAYRLAHRGLLTPIHRIRHSARPDRRLEIGPGRRRIEGFETLSIVPSRRVDYLYDAGARLPFADGTFACIYASHVLEHIAWYRTAEVLKEWTRLLASGGVLEIWVPDGLRICDAFVRAETTGDDSFQLDGWYRFNPDRDPCVWANGRIFSYGDGSGLKSDPNWHLALFSERHLRRLLEQSGLTSIRRLAPEEVRGHDHGWINLGMCGTKP